MSYLFDFASFIEELRENEDKKEIVESYESLYGKIDPDITKQVWFIEYVKCFYEYYPAAGLCLPEDLEDDFDWKLLFALVAASFSSKYSFEKSNEESDNKWRLKISVSNKSDSIEKYLDELWSFQISTLYEIYIEEQINLQRYLADEDNDETEPIIRERADRLDVIKNAIRKVKNGISTIYHYTSINTFSEILRSKSLRASDLRFLNDPKEKKIWYEVFDDAIESINKEIIEGEDSDIFLKEIKKRIDSYRDADCYLVSLSELQDELTQFDRYGDKLKGVSIGFDLSSLIDELFKYNSDKNESGVSGFLWGKVEYNMSTLKEDVINMLNELLKNCISSGKTPNEFFDTISLMKQFNKDCDKIFMRILDAKNADYIAEKEYRLYWVQERDKKVKKVDFFCRKPMIIPYVTLEFGQDKIPFKEIIVGSGNQDEVVDNIKEVLAILGYSEKEVKVKKSKLKYRSSD